MKLEDFDALVKDGTIDTEGLVKIRDSIRDMNDVIDNLNKNIEDSKNRISNLQETNSRLYLRVTEQVQPETEEPKISVDDIISNWR